MGNRYKAGLRKPEMKINPEFAGRLAKAHGAHYALEGRLLKQGEIAQQVGDLLGKVVSQQKVNTWFKGREPGYDELRALAAVLKTDIASLTGPPIEGQVARVDLLKGHPDPEPDDGIEDVEHTPKKPNRGSHGSGRRKHHRPIHKKPPS